jgi:hypothetical protein
LFTTWVWRCLVVFDGSFVGTKGERFFKFVISFLSFFGEVLFKFLFTYFIVRFGGISFNCLFFRLQPILCDYYFYEFSFFVQNPLDFCFEVSVWILRFCFGVLGFVILSCHFKMKRFNIFFLVIIFWCETLLSHFAKFCEMFMLNAKPLSKLLMSTLEKSSCLLLEILVTKTNCI